MLIREGTIEDYNGVEKIAKQVQELHVELCKGRGIDDSRLDNKKE